MTTITTDLSPRTQHLVFVREDAVNLYYRLGYDPDPITGIFATGYDLTAVGIAAQIKRSARDTLPLASFTVVKANQADPAERGKFSIHLTEVETLGITVARAVWDMQLDFPGTGVRTWVDGRVRIRDQVTDV